MIIHLPHPKPRREPVVAGSDYLNRPPRTLAEVIAQHARREANVVSLRDARQAAEPVRPCDSEDGAA